MHRVVDLVWRQRQDMADTFHENSPGHRAHLFGRATQGDRQPIDDDPITQATASIRRKNTGDDHVMRFPRCRI